MNSTRSEALARFRAEFQPVKFLAISAAVYATAYIYAVMFS